MNILIDFNNYFDDYGYEDIYCTAYNNDGYSESLRELATSNYAYFNN